MCSISIIAVQVMISMGFPIPSHLFNLFNLVLLFSCKYKVIVCWWMEIIVSEFVRDNCLSVICNKV